MCFLHDVSIALYFLTFNLKIPSYLVDTGGKCVHFLNGIGSPSMLVLRFHTSGCKKLYLPDLYTNDHALCGCSSGDWVSQRTWCMPCVVRIGISHLLQDLELSGIFKDHRAQNCWVKRQTLIPPAWTNLFSLIIPLREQSLWPRKRRIQTPTESDINQERQAECKWLVGRSSFTYVHTL